MRPVNDQAVAGAAEMRGDLLGPLEGRVRRPGPAHRNMRVRRRAADLVELGLEICQSQLHAIDAGDLADRALEAAFGRGAIVAHDVEDQGVVHFSRFLERGDEPPDLLVRVVEEAGIVLHQAAVDPLRLLGLIVPCRDLRGPRRELGVLGDDAHLLLAGEGLLAVLVPAARRTCPCTSRYRAWAHGAAHGRRRWRNRAATASPGSLR